MQRRIILSAAVAGLLATPALAQSFSHDFGSGTCPRGNTLEHSQVAPVPTPGITMPALAALSAKNHSKPATALHCRAAAV